MAIRKYLTLNKLVANLYNFLQSHLPISVQYSYASLTVRFRDWPSFLRLV